MKLKDALARFLRDHENSISTFRTYQAVLNPMVTALGPDRNIRNVTRMDVKDYAYDLRKKLYHGRTYAESTVVHYENVIKILFTWSVNCGLIKFSPADVVKGGTPRLSKAEDKAMSPEELEKLLNYAKWNKRLYALILYLVHTGCRAGGAGGLRVKDVNFEAGEAVVTEKGNKSRRVIFGPAASEAMTDWLNARSKRWGIDPNQTVFSMTGEPMSGKAITRMITTASDRAGIRHLGAHTIRHYFGHMMALRGVPALLATVFMGHSDPSITLKVYYPRDLETGRHLWKDYVSDEAHTLRISRPTSLRRSSDKSKSHLFGSEWLFRVTLNR